MTLKVVQLNIWKGKFLKELILFLRDENPDIICLQEVTSGEENFYEDNSINLFTALKEELNLNGAFAPSHCMQNDAASCLGNAVLTAGNIIAEKTVWLKKYAEVPSHDERDHPNCPRNALDCLIDLKGKEFHVIATHCAWTSRPVDTPEKIRQAHILASHLDTLGNAPFILAGDFNLPRGTEVLNLIESKAVNLLADQRWGVTRSTHPTIHKIAPTQPQGLLVDFIFTSPHFSPLTVDVPLVAVSDHLPVRATLQI